MACFRKCPGPSSLPLFILSLAAFTLAACASPPRIAYNKYNIHVVKQYKKSDGSGPFYRASYANMTDPGEGHYIVPMNSRIQIKRGGDGFYFQILDRQSADLPEDEVLFRYRADRMGMDVSAYIDMITSAEPVSMTVFSEKDLEGIKKGKALVGMSRNGVLAALGYPAAHATPLLHNSIWVYWANAYASYEVEFGEDGTVARVGGTQLKKYEH